MRLVTKPGRLLHQDRLLAHPAPTRRSITAIVSAVVSSALHDLDQLHAMDGIEEMHAAQAARIGQDRGHLGDAERRGVRRQHRLRGRSGFDVREERELEVDLLRSGLDHDVGIAARHRPRSVVVAEPRPHRRRVVRRRLAELDALRDRPQSMRRPALRQLRHRTRRRARCRIRPPSPRGRCRGPSCRRREQQDVLTCHSAVWQLSAAKLRCGHTRSRSAGG